MVKKSRRFAARQAALSRRKKVRRTTLTQKQMESAAPTPQPTLEEEPGTIEETPPTDSEEAAALPQPSVQTAGEGGSDTWRYAYVLADVKRTAIISGAAFVVIGILTFFLR